MSNKVVTGRKTANVEREQLRISKYKGIWAAAQSLTFQFAIGDMGPKAPLRMRARRRGGAEGIEADSEVKMSVQGEVLKVRRRTV